MTDVHTKAQRSRNMAAIKCKDTQPELLVRSLVHKLGYRFRLHRTDLPGKPDIAFISRRKVILVHGCFWHCHRCRYGMVRPATNAEFWHSKRQGNHQRDIRNLRKLRRLGWKPMVVWECWTKNEEKLKRDLANFLRHQKRFAFSAAR